VGPLDLRRDGPRHRPRIPGEQALERAAHQGKRRAQLVADVDQKVALDPQCPLGLFLGTLEVAFGLLPLSDVDDDAEQADHVTRLISERYLAGQDEHLATLVVVSDLFLVQERDTAIHGLAIEAAVRIGVRPPGGVVVRLTHHLARVGSPVERCEVLVAAEVAAFGIFPEDAIGDVVDHVLQDGAFAREALLGAARVGETSKYWRCHIERNADITLEVAFPKPSARPHERIRRSRLGAPQPFLTMKAGMWQIEGFSSACGWRQRNSSTARVAPATRP
jgi:hypothetical protein